MKNNKRKTTDMFDEIEGQDFQCDKAFDYGICVHKSSVDQGKAVAINAPNIHLLGRKIEKYLVEIIKNILIEMFEVNTYKNILIIGLGNEKIISDSLGVLTVHKILVTRGLEIFPKTSAITPNVFSQTGIETSDMVEGLVKLINPDLVIFIDSLASLSISRLGSSFQISNKEMQAGSGKNGDNKKMTKKTLGCDILSIGVPMLMYPNDFLKEQTCGRVGCKNFKKNNNIDNVVISVCDCLKSVKLLSDVIALAINQSFFPDFSLEEISVLKN